MAKEMTMEEKKFLEFIGKPFAGGVAACEDAAGMLKALGYTLQSYGSDATGRREWVYVKGSTVVKLSVVDHNACWW